MSVVHDFDESLARSHAQADHPMWERVYRSAFRDFSAMHSVRQDGWAQRAGIDRQVLLASGKVLKVDEKVREADYKDILVEVWSSMESKTPGWAWKDLDCDYIAYAVLPTETCYLLPFWELRRACEAHGQKWMERAIARRGGYRVVDARNRGYTTRSLAIPVDDLLGALARCMVIDYAEEAA